jgi:hypothetical protein
LSARFDATFAFAHLITKQDRHLLDSESDLFQEEPLILIPWDEVGESLPTVFWATVVGPEWVARIGADRIETAPAYRVERLATGGYYVQLSGDIRDLDDNFAVVAAARRRVIAHLGTGLFWAGWLPTAQRH